MKKATTKQIDRKMKKLARRLAEANIPTTSTGDKPFADVWEIFTEAFQLIRMTGYRSEYEKRVKQLLRARLA